MKPRLILSLLLALSPLAARAAEPAKSLYTSDQLVDGITAALKEHFRLEGDLQVTLERTWTPPSDGAVQWDLAITEFPGVPSSNMLLRVRLRADGKDVDQSTLLLHASLWRDAWFVRQPISSGTTFSSALLEARRVDAFHERDALQTTDGDDSYIFSREMSPDSVVTWHDVARRPLVHRGQVVEVTASEGRLFLSMKALAMENGSRGDLVTVRNLESRKDVTAIVTGDDQVEIHF